MTYLNAIKYLLSLPEKGDTPEDATLLERMRTVAAELDHPERDTLYVHIAGQSGKNSCARMLKSVLTAAGYSVGHYALTQLSMDPKDIRTRVTIGQTLLPYDDLTNQIARLSATYARLFPAVFPLREEVLFLIALGYFKDRKCDVVLIERTGQRNDPAILTDPSSLMFFTPTKEDELPSLTGLLPRGVQEVVCAPQHRTVYDRISDACAENGCRLTVPIYGELTIDRIRILKTVFTYREIQYALPCFSPCQTVNAITVIEAAQALTRLGLSLSKEAILRGLSVVSLPLKCEALSVEPTVLIACVDSNEEMDTLCASLTQIKEALGASLTVYASEAMLPRRERLTEMFAAYGLVIGDFIALDKDRVALARQIRQTIVSPRKQGVLSVDTSPKPATLFWGDTPGMLSIFPLIQKYLVRI